MEARHSSLRDIATKRLEGDCGRLRAPPTAGAAIDVNVHHLATGYLITLAEASYSNTHEKP